MLDAPPRNYERRHFPDLLNASLTPPWAIYSSSSQSTSSKSEASLTQDVKEDSLSDESICVQFAGDWPARHSPIIEPYLPPASVLEPPRATDEVRWSLDFPPKYIILPTAYFGLASCTATRRDESPSASPYYSAGRYEQRTLKRHASLTDRPPFYPPGPNQRSAVAESTFERSQRMREARQLYRSPQSRRALGTPACYRGSSSLSSLRNRASPVCTAQASSRSRSRGSAQGTMAPKSRQPTRQQVEKNRRDLWQSEPQLNKVEAHSKSKRSGRKEKKLTAPTQRTSPADCSYWLSRDYMPAKYIDTSTKLARSRHAPLPIESFRPQKTTLWYRSDPDIALTTSESEQEKTELMPTAFQITTDLTYQRPDTSACFKHGSEVQPSGNGTYAQEDSNPLVPRRLASSPIQINRTYTKSQRMAYQQELNILREGVNLKSSTETAPKNSTEERFPTYGVPSALESTGRSSFLIGHFQHSDLFVIRDLSMCILLPMDGGLLCVPRVDWFSALSATLPK
ncbi:unnamed protein product [Schistocephalus solidus]|uniref:Uncharacterized protein n=1 Tax=Schistocephalus solidus TaxID=70667 RepID=A0A183SF85_SCHSO|nr:unnamed protein product [Schistocephalus solidus]